MAKHVKRSVIPIYLIGVAWLGYALLFPLRTGKDYILCAGLSLVAFVVGKALFPDKVFAMPGEKATEPEPGKEKAEPKKEPEKETPKSTGNPEIDRLVKERERALSEMRRLNDNILDEQISAQIDHLEEVTRKIMDQVVAQPKKLPQIRRFLDYYLPTTLKILNAYDRMDAVGISGQNIDATKKKVEGMMDTISQAFDRQLDALFGEEALDISTDITVMENLLAREGLSGMRMDGSDEKDDGASSVHLEL
ncbi:MAG: 5-bromo-4-chloroindolyl phosphate hydrolysis family protein [Lawsonibacter sp.]